MRKRPTAQDIRHNLAQHRNSTSIAPEAGQHESVEQPKASTVIRHLDDLPQSKKKLLAIVYMRESSFEQRRKKNLRNRRAFLCLQLRQRNVELLAIHTEVACGKFLDGKSRPALVEAIEAARRARVEHPAAQVFVATDARNRFVRGPNYNGTPSTDPPSSPQLQQLDSMAREVVLVTLLHPDAPFGEVKSYETKIPDKLGSRSGKRVGRPRRDGQPKPGGKKEKRLRDMPKALLLFARGYSKRKIAKRLKVSEATIRNWLKSASY